MAFEFSPESDTGWTDISSLSISELTDQTKEIDCPFCQGSGEDLRVFDTAQSLGEGNVILKAALGMMVPGYFLGVTKKHLTSFAQLEPETLGEVDESLARHQAYLGDKFGEYFRLEHGSDNVIECGSGGCIDHAHTHLVPAVDVGEHIQDQLPWEPLDNYGDITEFRGKPYIYLGRAGRHYVVPEPALPSQWVRRQIAEVRGLEDWDWAIHYGTKELLATFLKLGHPPKGRFIFYLEKDTVEYDPSKGPRFMRGDISAL